MEIKREKLVQIDKTFKRAFKKLLSKENRKNYLEEKLFFLLLEFQENLEKIKERKNDKNLICKNKERENIINLYLQFLTYLKYP
jgi:hypothetical protein